MAISTVTRFALAELFTAWEPDPMAATLAAVTGERSGAGVAWSGRLSEAAFLSRLYDLDDIPSSDQRFENARQDIRQHRENNLDWDDTWILTDPRFGLDADDTKLLAFLAETLHPEVRTDHVEELHSAYNRILRPDRAELRETSRISGRPVFEGGPAIARTIPLPELGQAIASAVSQIKAYDVADFCDELGIPPHPDPTADPFDGKARYVASRLTSCPREQLVDLARTVHERLDPDSHLEEVLFEIALAFDHPVAGTPKNIVFASTGSKPQIVLDDAVNNDIRIVAGAETCLVYDRPIDPIRGVSFQMLADWWAASNPGASDSKPENALFKRLRVSVSDAEARILVAYSQVLRTHGFGLPALFPQVYLHYDPLTVKHRLRQGIDPLPRQRMDFLMLLPGNHRVVIELDGQQHYSTPDRAGTDRPDPGRYAEMMRGDRRLKLAGYEVYRFGGHEITDATAAAALLEGFFVNLLHRYGVSTGES